jgi:predicted RNA binding protein YcfA (HicA-like mRNA interferase family)
MPYVTGEQVESVAKRLGFRRDRRSRSGGHVIYVRDSDKRRVVIPLHAGKTLKPKTFAAIVRDMGITFDEFRALL